MRIMAIDYGEQRVGIAMTDLLKVLANPYAIYNRKHTGIPQRYCGIGSRLPQ